MAAFLAGIDTRIVEYADEINSRPVIYFTFKDCNAQTPEELATMLCEALFDEYYKYYGIAEKMPNRIGIFPKFEVLYKKIHTGTATLTELSVSVSMLEQVVYEIYQKPAILLWDEYDTPIMSSHEHKYHDKISAFIANFYGSALKGQQYLGSALLTGIQRVAKESMPTTWAGRTQERSSQSCSQDLFSKLNDVKVYTVLDRHYAQYFGITEQEAKELLAYYDLTLDDSVKQMYDGYHIGCYEIYNPWSLLYYCENRELRPYWVNTSSNALIRDCLKTPMRGFKAKFEELIENGSARVEINLETAYEELKTSATLWGPLCNAGYITVIKTITPRLAQVAIPNDEVI